MHDNVTVTEEPLTVFTVTVPALLFTTTLPFSGATVVLSKVITTVPDGAALGVLDGVTLGVPDGVTLGVPVGALVGFGFAGTLLPPPGVVIGA